MVVIKRFEHARRQDTVSRRGIGVARDAHRPTRANGQPAFGCYLRSQPCGMMVLTLSGSKVDEITFVADPRAARPLRSPRTHLADDDGFDLNR